MFGFNKLKKRQAAEQKVSADAETIENYKNREKEQKYLADLEKLQGVKIEGDSYIYDGKEYQLSKETLARCDLAPDGRIDLEGREVKISKSFRVGSRDVIIGYVESDEGEFKARSYYRSNSQGLWRYLPDYVERHEIIENPDGTRVEGLPVGGVSWYGKGYDEASLTLPTEMQCALNWEVENRPAAEIGEVVPEFLLVGTARRYESKADYRLAKQNGTLAGDYYREVNSRPKIAYNPDRQTKVDPNILRVSEEHNPDFNRKVGSYNYESSLTGKTEAEVFSNSNNNLRWTFCSDRQGRSWIGNVECASPITSTGLRRDWVNPGDLATPLYEYRSQSDGYGDESDTRGNYVNMWNKYLSRFSMIRDYQYKKSLSRPRPSSRVS